MRRPPGREAFPVTFIATAAYWNSVKLSAELGGGSINSLLVIETLEGEVSAYIPTNVISITDVKFFNPTCSSPDPPRDNAGILSRVGGATGSGVQRLAVVRPRSFRELNIRST